MKPFNRERFLYWMLAGIFVFEGLLFTAGFVACWRGGGLEACPALGDRYEATFNVMVATTLALLTGGAVATQLTKKPEPPTPPARRDPPTGPAARTK